MTNATDIRNVALCPMLAILLFPLAALSGDVHVYLANEDCVTGKEMTLDDRSLSILTPHCGRMVIERSAVKGISADTEHASEILQFTSQNDVAHNRNGDRLSGRVVEIRDDTIFMEAFFAEAKTVTVEMELLDYLTFACENKAERTQKPDEVRVIFTNGDVVSGKMAGLESGRFVLDAPCCGELRFDTTALRSLHNAKNSKEFFQGGIAEAVMNILEKSSESRGYGPVYHSLIKSFLKDGDRQGALLIFRRMSSYVRDQYVFQRIGDEFLANKMLEAAVQAYERMMEGSPTYYAAYAKLFEAYTKMEKYSEAAEVYERLLSTPAINLSNYGMSIAKVRTDLSDVYIKLKEFDKAAEQLRRVIVMPTEKEDIRKTALAKLISIFREQGKIEALTQKYKEELAKKNEVIGDGYLQLVRRYRDEGKIMKAKTYVQRLDQLGLTEYAGKARQLIEQ